MNALEIRNLTKHYEGFSLGPVNLTLPSGCIMGFIGENGAGKSTTIKLILDLIKRDGGEVTILGKTLGTESSELKEQIGVVMDECSFPENLTGRDIDAVLKSCYHTWDSARFNQYCRKFSLPEKRRCGEYSRGMKMKLAIAVALSHGSRILLLDEGDKRARPGRQGRNTRRFLEFIQDERNSIFLSSHIISDLEKSATISPLFTRARCCSVKKDVLLAKVCRCQMHVKPV